MSKLYKLLITIVEVLVDGKRAATELNEQISLKTD